MTGPETILVVDDAPGTLEVIKRNLTSIGYRVFTAADVAQAVRTLESAPVDLVITDFKMPGADGFDLLRHVRENYRDIEVVMITGFPSLEGAVRAVKTGAEEYLAKPFTEEELIAVVRRALEKLQERRKAFSRKIPENRYGLIGESLAMRTVYQYIAKAADTLATILICGESGTGKEIVARAIHYNGQRASAPFVAVNCGAIPENLLESELFGYVKGAFTGATESRAGFFQTADRGTIFLDEVSDASPSMQVKLLRVLQDGEVFMLGSSRSIKTNVRIMAATNKYLEDLVRKGAFREDLFYRLNVVTISLPPLRERDNDIELLIHNFIERFSKELGRKPPRISDDALRVLKDFHWPGNIRELENVVQRFVVMADREVIEVCDLPSLMRFSASGGSDVNRTLAEIEMEHIQRVLASVDGNKTRAAEILGVDRKTLRDKLKKIQGGLS
ncbi:MAG: sigma-54-dependent Fis family transcriptional regulator [Deltaproteobacteria bacterium]|nr:sigma-54-dependent Fis family transcriptional regulator [Deltaproteobacteria bacterium]